MWTFQKIKQSVEGYREVVQHRFEQLVTASYGANLSTLVLKTWSPIASPMLKENSKIFQIGKKSSQPSIFHHCRFSLGRLWKDMCSEVTGENIQNYQSKHKLYQYI